MKENKFIISKCCISHYSTKWQALLKAWLLRVCIINHLIRNTWYWKHFNSNCLLLSHMALFFFNFSQLPFLPSSFPILSQLTYKNLTPPQHFTIVLASLQSYLLILISSFGSTKVQWRKYPDWITSHPLHGHHPDSSYHFLWPGFYLFIYLFIWSLVFLGPHLKHMEVHRLGVELEL